MLEIDGRDDELKREARYRMMTESSVRCLVLKMSVPTILSMLVTAFYNLADTFFVGRLSTEATAGVGVSFAYMFFIQACGFFFGHGSGNYISQALGARKYKDAETMAATGFLTTFIIGAFAAVAGIVFLSPLSRLLGATQEIEPYSNDYLRYIILATPFMMSSLVLNNQLRLQGNARFAMIGIISGAVLNIILDPIFIFTLNLGTTGASLATCVSQIVGWTILLIGTRFGGNVHIKLNRFSLTWKRFGQIAAGGLPSLARQVFMCVSTVMLNWAAAKYAEKGFEASSIAAFAVVTRYMMFTFSVVLGIGQGFQPVCGFNYGAGLIRRVREAFLFTTCVMTAFLVFAGIVSFVFAEGIVTLFRDEDAMLISIGEKAMRWRCVALPLLGFSTAANMMFQTTRKTFPATLLALGRQGIFFVPTIMILPVFFGLSGVMATQALADVLTFALTIPFVVNEMKTWKKIKKNG